MNFPEKTPQRLFGFPSTDHSTTARLGDLRSFTPTDYKALWHALTEAIAEKSFFSGTLSLPLGDCTARLTTTLIIYRAKECRRVENIVPVWWQMTTHRGSEDTPESECPNDFSFRELVERFIPKNTSKL